MLRLVALFTLAIAAYAETCQVASVTDGDTLRAVCSGVERRIRVSSIDAPERDQEHGSEAREYVMALLRQGTVKAEVHDWDRYGRMVARVTLPDGRDLGRELVRMGHAWHYSKYSRDARLADLETQARTAGRGLWSNGSPKRPSDYRSDTRGMR